MVAFRFARRRVPLAPAVPRGPEAAVGPPGRGPGGLPADVRPADPPGEVPDALDLARACSRAARARAGSARQGSPVGPVPPVPPPVAVDLDAPARPTRPAFE